MENVYILRLPMPPPRRHTLARVIIRENGRTAKGNLSALNG